jgi:site-specific DNA recombinase
MSVTGIEKMAGQTGKPYCLLCRVSTPNQAKDSKHGIPSQIKATKALAERLGVSVAGEYIDAISGMSESREAFYRLLADSENYEGVIIYDVTRLARSEEISHRFLRMMQEAGLKVYASNRGLEPLQQDFRTAIDIAVSAEERRNIIKRTQNGLLAEAENGKLPNGIWLFGYRNVPGQNAAVIHPEEANIIREVFTLGVKGLSLRSIAREMMSRKRPTMKGSSIWHQHTVRRVLTNSAYKGEYIWNWKGERTYILEIPPIVDPDTWQRAQRTKRGAHAKLGFPLSGHLRCGICGFALSARRSSASNKVFPYYRCNSHKEPRGKCELPYIRREPLEKAVEAQLRKVLSDRAVLSEMLEASMPKELDVRTKQQIKSLEDEHQRVIEMTQRGLISLDKAEELVKEIKRKVKALDVKPAFDVPLKEYMQASKNLDFAALLDYAKAVVTVGLEGFTLKVSV